VQKDASKGIFKMCYAIWQPYGNIGTPFSNLGPPYSNEFSQPNSREQKKRAPERIEAGVIKNSVNS